MTGITSVTYRPHSVEEIIAFAKVTGLKGIEWGGDVHVPAGDLVCAQRVAQQTKEAGLQILSYGSYYKLGQVDSVADSSTAFAPVLASALALGAPLIRIWAGTCGSAVCTPEQRIAWTEELQYICGIAKAEGLRIGLEYHRNTLTDTAESTAMLLAQANCENLFTYWQMNPDVSFETHLHEIAMLKSSICAVHVFHWIAGNIRETLGEHLPEWHAYLEALDGCDIPYILEFVKDDTLAQGEKEARTLQALLGA